MQHKGWCYINKLCLVGRLKTCVCLDIYASTFRHVFVVHRGPGIFSYGCSAGCWGLVLAQTPLMPGCSAQGPLREMSQKKNLMKPPPWAKLIFSLISSRGQCEFWDPRPICGGLKGKRVHINKNITPPNTFSPLYFISARWWLHSY